MDATCGEYFDAVPSSSMAIKSDSEWEAVVFDRRKYFALVESPLRVRKCHALQVRCRRRSDLKFLGFLFPKRFHRWRCVGPRRVGPPRPGTEEEDSIGGAMRCLQVPKDQRSGELRCLIF